VPVVGNGDVVSVEDYVQMRAETGCDAVMIGRGAQGNPWLFARLRDLVRGLPDPGPPSIEDRRHVVARHVALMTELRPGPRLIHEVRKASAWYLKGLPGANSVRQAAWKAAGPQEAIAIVHQHLDALSARGGDARRAAA
jgi:tRNA-dihydrouridine synthase